jgi:uncharacterized protein YjbI with pentapeptide repeats
MASKEHLGVLKQGIRVWNRWRKNNPDIFPDLSKADLSGGDFAKADLNKANLTRANLIRTDLSEANLREAHFRLANLSEADLSGAKLIGADLTRANLTRANLNDANLSGANLSGADIIKADLSEADLVKANLSGANFIRSHLVRANLSMADLSEAKLNEANLSEAKLNGAFFTRTNLSRAIFNKASLNRTIFADVNLGDVNGLDTVVHHGPSSVGIDTIHRSRGKIPEVFLRGVGVPNTLIEYMRSLVDKEIRYYSCSICYSIENHEFAERLYSDLLVKGISVWLAPKDINDESKSRENIFEANRLYGKLFLVLSEHNINSDWVKTEIRRARQDEIRNNIRKLFPIGLIDFTTIVDWETLNSDSDKNLGLEIRQNLIDFSNWKDYDAYKKALDLLLRDLQVWE